MNDKRLRMYQTRELSRIMNLDGITDGYINIDRNIFYKNKRRLDYF